MTAYMLNKGSTYMLNAKVVFYIITFANMKSVQSWKNGYEREKGNNCSRVLGKYRHLRVLFVLDFAKLPLARWGRRPRP